MRKWICENCDYYSIEAKNIISMDEAIEAHLKLVHKITVMEKTFLTMTRIRGELLKWRIDNPC